MGSTQLLSVGGLGHHDSLNAGLGLGLGALRGVVDAGAGTG